MAVTIAQAPDLYQPTYNDVMYVLTSTNTAQTSFKYLADIYINGSGTKTERLRVAVDPDFASGEVFIDEILSSFLTQDIGSPTGQVGTTANPNSILSYIVKFGEEYEVAGVLTQFPDLTVDTSRYAWNASYEYEDFVGMDYTNYFLDGAAKKFLTDSPSTIDTMATNSGWLYFLHGAATPISYFRVRTKNALGIIIGTWDITNTLTAFASVGEFLGKVASQPITINALPNGQFTAGVQPVFTGVEGSYDIQAYDGGGVKISELKTFTIIDPCKFTRWNVIFQTRQGGFDSFTFSLLSRDVDSIERTFYKKNPNRLTSATTYDYSLADREKATFFTKSTRTRTLNSNWVDEDTHAWLEQLATSPVVYLEDGSNNLIAVNVTNTAFTTRTRVNDKLFNFVLELEMGDNYRQRG
jgi:hypothetical protein